LEADAGRILMVGLAGPDLSSGEKKSLEGLRPGGVILFRRNLDSRERLANLVDELDRVLPEAPWVAVDQEGGRVSRLEPWIGPTPSAWERAAAGPHEAYRFGCETGRELAAIVGIKPGSEHV
jgi:beta-N-acetylhexosaminidase